MKLPYLFLSTILLLLAISVVSLRISSHRTSAKLEISNKNTFYNYKKALVQLQKYHESQTNLSKAIDTDKDEEESEVDVVKSQIKAIKKQIKVAHKLIKSLQVLEKNTKNETQKKRYSDEIKATKNLTKTLQLSSIELKKVLTHLTNTNKGLVEESKKNADMAHNIEKARNKTIEIQKDKESKALAKATRFAQRKLKKKNVKATDGSNLQNQIEAASLAKSEFLGALAYMPGEHCVLKNSAPVAPKLCPVNFLRESVLCRQECDPGFSFCGALCWENCGGNSPWGNPAVERGIYCSSQNRGDNYRWKVRVAYAPQILPDSNSLVPCEDGYYKNGAFCYPDCKRLGMSNCAVGICGVSCTAQAASFNFHTSNGVSDALLNAASLSPVQFPDNIRKIFDILNTDRHVWDHVQGFYGPMNPASYGTAFGTNAKRYMANTMVGRFTDNSYYTVGTEIARLFKEISLSGVSTIVLKTIDFLTIAKQQENCAVGCLATEQKKVQCAKDILAAVMKDSAAVAGFMIFWKEFANSVCPGGY